MRNNNSKLGRERERERGGEIKGERERESLGRRREGREKEEDDGKSTKAYPVQLCSAVTDGATPCSSCKYWVQDNSRNIERGREGKMSCSNTVAVV